ncbi:sharpin isoform X3 [Pelodiscus sinensis]|uniref:sharpin isoform X3 n=1 Tax=Pelodiscus sinensis TaxID=13735 RepID=UPI003F6D466E
MAPPTVLMSVRAWAARPLRLLPPAGASPAGDALLRLQLSVRPGPGPGPPLFRLALRHTDARRSQSVAEYDLKDVTYTVQSALCHELALRRGEEDPLLLHFEDEREAHEWWTVLSSSLREAQKAAESPGELVPPPALLPAASGSAPTTPAPDTPQPAELSHREDLALRLARAIEFGDEQAASQCAVALAQQQASLRILLPESSYPADEIRMKVGVEDATCSTNITIRVHAHMPLRTLRQQVFREYGFHPSVQRWIIGQCLCADDRTLGSYGIRRDGDTAFLYLLSATRAGLSEQRCEEDHALATLPPAPSLADGAGAEETRRSSALPSMAPKRAWLPGTGGKMDIGEISQHLGMLQLCSTAPSQPKAAPPNAAPPAPAQAGWPCPTCTFINKPTRPGCEMCSTARPAAYVVPGSHRPDTSELWRMQQEEEGIVQYQQALAVERRQNFQRLLQLEEEGLVPSPEAMDCPICCLPVARGEGVLLRECLHSFCRDCLRQVISYSREPQVSCPFRDNAYACSRKLQEREVRALVSAEEYRQFLDRGLVAAESRAQNSYHCSTPDCRGWCLREDAATTFACPVCGRHNCLLCQASHEGKSCQQHQADLQLQAENEAAARQTQDMLQGPGDTSGGCRCNVDGQRCHPHCQNCH